MTLFPSKTLTDHVPRGKLTPAAALTCTMLCLSQSALAILLIKGCIEDMCFNMRESQHSGWECYA